jgi:hypothetical protein
MRPRPFESCFERDESACCSLGRGHAPNALPLVSTDLERKKYIYSCSVCRTKSVCPLITIKLLVWNQRIEERVPFFETFFDFFGEFFWEFFLEVFFGNICWIYIKKNKKLGGEFFGWLGLGVVWWVEWVGMGGLTRAKPVNCTSIT